MMIAKCRVCTDFSFRTSNETRGLWPADRRQPPRRANRDQAAFLIAEMSNSRVTLSETSTPPASSAALKFTP